MSCTLNICTNVLNVIYIIIKAFIFTHLAKVCSHFVYTKVYLHTLGKSISDQWLKEIYEYIFSPTHLSTNKTKLNQTKANSKQKYQFHLDSDLANGLISVKRVLEKQLLYTEQNWQSKLALMHKRRNHTRIQNDKLPLAPNAINQLRMVVSKVCFL